MKRIVLFLAIASMTVGSCTKAGILSEKKMTSIYIDMFLIDRCIEDMWEFRAMADTTFVYGPILEKHNCSEEKFVRSVQYYLEKPNKYGRILKNVKAQFEKMEQEAVETRDIPEPMPEMEDAGNDVVKKVPLGKRKKIRENIQ